MAKSKERHFRNTTAYLDMTHVRSLLHGTGTISLTHDTVRIMLDTELSKDTYVIKEQLGEVDPLLGKYAIMSRAYNLIYLKSLSELLGDKLHVLLTKPKEP